MSKEERAWNKKFIEYMNMIVSHPNYKGLPIKRKKDGSLAWIATAQSDIGKGRIKWCEQKAQELGIPTGSGMYADVMRKIHPTGWKVCQTCGREMSIFYFYPNANFLKSLNRHFGTEYTDCDHVSDIWDDLLFKGVRKEEIARFFIKEAGLSLSIKDQNKDKILSIIEEQCRKGTKKIFGPGAMSNFPDRFDGFHTYNRCCRASEDKGRSKENLKSYTKDRRAYEYWSDGNIHAANQFMGSRFFEEMSADHIGPISLGFVHDPRYLQKMPSGDNSSKRDRLLFKDVEKIIETEKRTGVYPMSWQSKLIWEYIKGNYKRNIDKISTKYRDALKQNMINYMYILLNVLNKCPNNGKEFLIRSFLKKKFKYFNYSYQFNEKGEIISKKDRHFTERNVNETDRYVRIAIQSIYEYNEKENRNSKEDLNFGEKNLLNTACVHIEKSKDYQKAKIEIENLIEAIERRLIKSF